MAPWCPLCRQELVVSARRAYMPRFHIGTPPPSEPDGSEGMVSATSAISELLWWPVSTSMTAYNVARQLTDGRLRLIVDPGAWTNRLGSNLARRMAEKAIAHGKHTQQTRMTEPLHIRGVGDGSQRCEWEVVCPIAVPTVDGPASYGLMTSPVVEGSGSELPGLLGLRTIEEHKGILDTGRR